MPKSGGSEIQALRYPKEIWKESDAKAHCKKRGGSFEAAKEEKKELRTLKLPIQYRTFQVRKEEIDEKARTVPLSFSSELPVERWWGMEILGRFRL